MTKSQGHDLEAEITELQRTIVALQTERDAGTAQKAALAEVLGVINTSPANTQPVFDLIAERTRVLCRADAVNVIEYDGAQMHIRSLKGYTHNATEGLLKAFPRPAGVETLPGRAVLARVLCQVSDVQADPGIMAEVRALGFRSGFALPLMHKGRVVGVITLTRFAQRPFSAAEIALVEAFADQGVIAIENARLLGELRDRTGDLQESLEYQTATNDVLKVISRSSFDLEPVFQEIVSTSVRLCRADQATIYRYQDEEYRWAAGTALPPEYEKIERAVRIIPSTGTLVGRVALERGVVQILDAWTDPLYEVTEEAKLGGVRTMVGVPLMRDGEPIGVIGLARRRVEAYTQRQIDLVRTFADQAVIAIENARLITEQREALEQQTATAEILGMINASPGDLAPVFNAMLEKAMRLCGAAFGILRHYEGSQMHTLATLGVPPPYAEYMAHYVTAAEPGTYIGMALETGKPAQILNMLEGSGYKNGNPGARAIADLGGARTVVHVPLVKDGVSRGLFTLYRQEVHAFSDKQIALLGNFAAQAVIAMENTRLITEQREALERQTATSEVLGVINASPGDLAPVFDAMLDKAMRLCGAAFGSLYTYDGENFKSAAQRGVPAAYAEFRSRNPPRLQSGNATARLLETRQPYHVLDMKTHEFYLNGNPNTLAMVELGGIRTMLSVPLLKDAMFLGYISVYRQEVRAYSDKQIALLEDFAAQAVIAMENARLITEQREALAQQTATADILRAINASPGNLTPVFEMILEKAHTLCGAAVGNLAAYEDGKFRALATHGFPSNVSAALHQPIAPTNRQQALLRGERYIQDPDIRASASSHRSIWNRTVLEHTKARTGLWLPLRKDGELIGFITSFREEVRPFTERAIMLLENFAAQAVIAMENARLITEQREALEQQTATAEVLGVINASPGNLAPVFDAMLEKAMQLCDTAFGSFFTYDGDATKTFHAMAHRNVPVGYAEFREKNLLSGTNHIAPTGRLVATRRTVHVPDMVEEESYKQGGASARVITDIGGARTFVLIPLLKDAALIGLFSLYRTVVRPYSDKQIALLENFAAQAVIAMENARLLEELRQQTEALALRNSEFGERIEQQSATIDVLKVMSASPGDPTPVFALIVERALAFCQSQGAAAIGVKDGQLQLYAHAGATQKIAANYEVMFPRPIDRSTLAGRAVLAGEVVESSDIQADRAYALRDGLGGLGATSGLRAVVAVPMLRMGKAIGSVIIGREAPGYFTETQIELLKTFAEQAVIAISSAETYRELQDRTAALAARNSEFGERIEQQSATIDVLKVMSASPGDPQPVFDLITQQALRLCNGVITGLFGLDGGLVHLRSIAGLSENEASDYRALFPMAPNNGTTAARAILEKRIIHVRDIDQDPDLNAVVRRQSWKSALTVPLMRNDVALGAISLGAEATGGFTDSQVELVKTFAEQTVIAMGSAENHRALQARTDELTRSVSELQALEEVLRAVNSSLDLDTVLSTIINRAVQLSQADEGTIYEYDETDKIFVPKAAFGMTVERVEALRERRIRIGETHLGRSAQLRAPVHVSDVQQDPAVGDFLEGIHAVLAVPLLRDEKVIGGLVIRRREAGDFAPSTATLLQTFAGQSVLAIENARLFEQLAERGTEASRARVAAETALEDLRRTQDRLVQTEKMASLGQLTAGIAHEIKNPLNFVNNFSDLSVDLLTELNEAIAPLEAAADPKLREVIDDLTETLKSNLQKIAEHGRRADSIVKNMLLHSRSGVSERRAVDLNAVAEEALNLAYHGARAETPGFNITMDKDLDPTVGSVELYPQEISRVLVNLINNGFYAAYKRAEQELGFEPTLRLSTRSLGNEVEIRVRDNGTGIPADVRAKIFEPFFTTKPAGQGTGLGLSLSFDIITKQHGGQLSVDSEPGNYTEFTITLPRQLPAAEGGKS